MRLTRWLSRLAAGGKRLSSLEPVWLEGDERVEVVGESHYQQALRSICGREAWTEVRHECVALLVPEPTNPHDPNAVMVQIDGKLVGYLSRADAVAYRPTLRPLAAQGKAAACHAVIAGRGPGSRTSNLGVFLHLPPP
ncbi:MAG: hypothetical protein IRZ21_13030 [Thermoleophilaceae bacterium]|nr:hypothetical protein [Thermoleophilaceae bacterium]